MYKILCLDDDEQIQYRIEYFFKHSILIQWVFASDIRQGLDYLNNGSFDMLVVEPEINRLMVFDLILQAKNLSYPVKSVVCLSRNVSSLAKQRAFANGVSNYLEKPVDLPLLNAVIEMNLKRFGGLSQEVIKLGDLVLNREKVLCRYKDIVLDLTPTEFILLQRLMSVESEVVDKDELCHLASGVSKEPISHKSLEMHIAALRNKLPCGECLKTKRGFGYFFEVEKVA